MTKARHRLFAVVWLLLACSPLAALDVQNFQPALGAENELSLYSTTSMRQGQFSLGYLFDYAANPFVLDFTTGHSTALVRSLYANQFSAAVGVVDRVTIGLGTSYNSLAGEYLSTKVKVRGLENTDPAKVGEVRRESAMGDLRLSVKVSVLEDGPSPIGLAVVPFGNFGLSGTKTFAGSGAWGAGALLAIDKKLPPYVTLTGNIGGAYWAPSGPFFKPDPVPMAGVGVTVSPLRWLDAVAEFQIRRVNYHIDQIDPGYPFEADVAVKFHAPYGVGFTVGGGAGFTHAIGTPAYRILAGASFQWPPADREKKEPVKPAAKPRPAPPAPKPVAPAKPAPAPAPAPAPVPAPVPAPAPAPVPAPVPAPRMVLSQQPSGVILYDAGLYVPAPVYFAEGSSKNVTKVSVPILKDLLAILRDYPGIQVELRGFADEREMAAAPNLAKDRAEMVRDYFARNGIAASRLVATGLGSKYAVDSTGTDEGRKKNMRVEVVEIR